jgi:OmpA-OmpF porin, OOP family
MRLSKFVSILLIAMVPMVAFAEETEGFTIAGMLGKTFMNGDVEDDNHWSAALGYQFDSPWAVELVYADMEAGIRNSGLDADVSRVHLDALYHFLGNEKARPYFSFGFGKEHIDLPVGSDDNTLLNIGAGVKFALATNTSLRGEIKLFEGGGTNEIEAAASIGLFHVFGKAKQPAKQVAATRMDSDGDGVYDDEDSCPNTASGVSVDTRGCARDDDGDGVINDKDSCPGTTDRRAKINARGCYTMLREVVQIELNVQFDNDSSDSRSQHRAEVERAAKFMQQYPNSKITIQGHTDSNGPAAYNKDLSARRASTIADMLVDDFGIARSRVTSVGYGEEQPVATNATADGRQKNRRVVGVVEATKQTVQQK